MATTKHTKIKLREVNRHLVCRLCRGYYVDATTIAECLHSFCRSCIIKYLEQNSFCPICEVQIHKTKPYLSLRLDKALQDVVYKVVPGLYHDEMRRRREFYANRQEQILFATPEQCGLEERILFSPEDSISLSLEYLESDDYESETVSSQSSESGDNPDLLSFPQQLGLIKLKNNDGKASRRESQDVQENSAFPKRYLQCPAVVNVGHLKKFIRMKHDLTDKMQVSVIHKRVPLPDHYTLMDVAYIYTWKRNSPLRFFYQIYQTKKQKIRIQSEITEKEESKTQTEELKSTKTEIDEKVNNIEPIKPTEVKTTVINNTEKSEMFEVDVKQTTVTSNETNSENSNKLVAETEPEKSVKSVSGDNINSETKEGFEPEPEPEMVVNNKSEKSNGVNTTENKTKTDSQKRKSVKVENNETNGSEIKEKELDDRERLLLNPISGKLESVPSTDQNKSVNGTEEKKENEDCVKKEASVKAQKKSDSQNSKKSNVNLLKSFRKEKHSLGKDKKVEKLEIKNSKSSSLTITPIPKNEKPSEKQTKNLISPEVKAKNKESEYDFDGSSPPSKIIPLQEFSKHSKFSKYIAEHRNKWLSKETKNNWMSLKDFRKKMKENEANADDFMKNKKKLVPFLYKLNTETQKATERKTPNGKLETENPKETKTTPIVNNDKVKNDESKEVSNSEVLTKTESSLKIIKVEKKDEENSSKLTEEKKSTEVSDSKPNAEHPQAEDKPENVTPKESPKKKDGENVEGETKKNSRSENLVECKGEPLEAMDLSKSESSPKSDKNPLENLINMAKKTETSKGDEKMMEALVSAAQKQSLEPLLKIPQYSQLLKNSMPLGSPGKNISSSDISQALQFLEEFRSDMKSLEMTNKLNPNSVLEQFAQKSGNLEPYQQLYQQKIDLIRRLKRQQQISPNELESSQKKIARKSPVFECKRKLPSSPERNTKKSPTSEEINQYKSSMDRTLSQMQMMELQNRMLAAQNYKNLPGLIQYYNKPSNTSSGTSSTKSNQQKTKSSSHSPNKSPQGSSSSASNSPISASSSEASLYNTYNTLMSAGLSSDMTYHQMFQSYLSQQEQLNQIKNENRISLFGKNNFYRYMNRRE